MSQNSSFKVGDTVRLPQSNLIGKVIQVDEYDQPSMVEIDGKFIKIIDQVIEKVSLIVKILSFFKSLFKF